MAGLAPRIENTITALCGEFSFSSRAVERFPQTLAQAIDSLASMPAGRERLDLIERDGHTIESFTDEDGQSGVSTFRNGKFLFNPRLNGVRRVRTALAHDLHHYWQRARMGPRALIANPLEQGGARPLQRIFGNRVFEGDTRVFEAEVDAFFDGRTLSREQLGGIFNNMQTSSQASGMDRLVLFPAWGTSGLREAFDPASLEKLPDVMPVLIPRTGASSRPYIDDTGSKALYKRLQAQARRGIVARLVLGGNQTA